MGKGSSFCVYLLLVALDDLSISTVCVINANALIINDKKKKRFKKPDTQIDYFYENILVQIKMSCSFGTTRKKKQVHGRRKLCLNIK